MKTDDNVLGGHWKWFKLLKHNNNIDNFIFNININKIDLQLKLSWSLLAFKFKCIDIIKINLNSVQFKV